MRLREVTKAGSFLHLLDEEIGGVDKTKKSGFGVAN